MFGGSLYAAVPFAAMPVPYQPFVFDGVGLFIEGQEVSGMVRVDSLNFDGEVGRRGTLSFMLKADPSDNRYECGMDVRLVRESTLIWAGTIENLGESIPLGADVLFTEVEAVDNNSLADRRLAAAVFVVPDQTADEIASTLVLDLLAADGVSLGTIVQGSGVVKAVFSYVKLSTALDELAQTSGFIWYIDEFRRFCFHEAGSVPAPFAINDASAPFRSLKVTRNRAQFRSRQYLQAGKAQTDPLLENFAGDGKRRTFTLGFQVSVAPTVTVNAVPKTIGIRKVDTGKDFYYALADKEITQDTAGTLLTTIDTLAVSYIGQFPITMDALNLTAISERQAIEGGSGLYDEAEKNEDISDISYAQEYVSSLLRRFGKIPKNVTFETDVDGIKSGMVLTLSLADEDVAGEFLVTNVQAHYIDSAGFFRYQVTATDGEFLGGWAEFYRALENRGKRFNIRENEVASLARASYDIIEAADSFNLIDPIDDGTDDPYTGLETVSHLQDPELAHYIGKSNVGKERFDL